MALLVDGLSAEREQGITIDVAYRYFATPRRSFIVADTPGHEQYTRNMATGASTRRSRHHPGRCAQGRARADAPALASSSRMLGVRHVVLAVNKMDLVGFDQARFDDIAAGLPRARSRPRLRADHGRSGLGTGRRQLSTRSRAMPWYRGPSLIEHLETVDATPALSAAGFRLPVQWVNRPNLDFRGFAGTIARGSISPTTK